MFQNGGGTDLTKINRGVLTGKNSAARHGFNLFTRDAGRRVNWVKSATFGTQVDQFSWTSPRTFPFSLGLQVLTDSDGVTNDPPGR